MRREVEVAVVGAGVMGLATARALAANGTTVTVLERFRVGHARGSSHGTSRIFRVVYDTPRFARLALAALPLWRSLERETGETLLTTTGSVDVGPDLSAYTRGLEGAELDYELIDAKELRRRHPRLHPRDDDQCLLQADGGIVHADRTLRAFRTAASAAGAEILEDARVTHIEPGDDGATLSWNGETLHARSVVLTAGAWSAPLLEQVGVSSALRPTRETIVYLAIDGVDELPTVIDRSATVAGPGREGYALPAPGVGLKAGIHKAGRATDPEEAGQVDEDTVERAREWAGRLYGVKEPRVLRAETCLYTNTDDDGFVLERRGSVVLGAACSGHGFKFAPEVGRQLAELASQSLA